MKILQTKKVILIDLIFFGLLLFHVNGIKAQTGTSFNTSTGGKESYAFAWMPNTFKNQSSPVHWTTQAFEYKVFIENKGQFDEKLKWHESPILFGANTSGTELYFTSKGLTYQVEAIVKETSQSEHTKVAAHTYTIHMEWLDANPHVQIFTKDPVTEYFNYQMDDKHQVYYTHAFEKIVYKDLYPGIDVEYIFHKEKGIKYTLILHPGADPSLVKMKYTGADKLYKDKDGNLHITNEMINIIDHTPITYYASNSNAIIASSVNVNANLVTFNLDNYNKEQTIEIDPWNVPSGLTTNNTAYEVESDRAGNVYIYGGRSNYKLRKFNSSGIPQWTYTTTFNGFIGDLAVDPSGNAYVTSGCCEPGAAIKVDNAGILQWTSPLISGTLFIPPCLELWTLAFNCDFTRLAVGGGCYMGYLSYINLSTGFIENTVNVSTDEAKSLAGGPYRNFYCLASGVFPAASNNLLIAVDSAFAPVYTVPNGYLFPYSGTAYGTYGYNGIAVNNNFIYTSDGALLIRRNISSGILVNVVLISGGLPRFNGGIAIDSCGYIYVGTQTAVLKYDAVLNFIDSASTSERVYDVAIGTGGEVLACGPNYVASLELSACPPVSLCCPAIGLTFNTTAASCSGNDGTATVMALGGVTPYTYSWNTTPPQTSAAATGLAAGTYIITVTDVNGCSQTDTVLVSNITGLTASISSSSGVTCQGENNGSATATANGGIPPYTYSWNTTPSQINATASGLSAGNYIVQVTDFNGCQVNASVSIPQPSSLIAVIVSSADNACFGDNNGSATASATGGSPLYSYFWNTIPPQTTQTISGLNEGTYTVTVTDANFCIDTASVTIAGPAALILQTSGSDSICSGEATTLSATVQGGTVPYSFIWNPGGVSSSSIAVSPDVSTIYTVIVTDANNCIASQSDSVTIYPLPALYFTANPNSGCVPLCVAFSNTMSNIYTSAWSFGDGGGGSGAEISHCYNNPGNYSITFAVTDGNGCANSLTVPDLINVFPNPIAGFSMTPSQFVPVSQPVLFYDRSTGADHWLWNFGDILNSTSTLQDPSFNYAESGLYTVNLTVSNNTGCTDTVSHTIIIEPEFSLYIPNAFTPDNDGINDFFAPQGAHFDSFEMEIYNRWGERIYYTVEIDKPWDGKVKGEIEISKQDIYVYKMRVKDFNNDTHYYIGNVTLLK